MRRILASIGILILATLLFVTYGPYSYRAKVSSFRQQMQSTTTADELQAWALRQLERVDEIRHKRHELTDVPTCLIAPVDGPPTYLAVHDEGSAHVVAQWGGGFGHWGLLIGDASFPVPRDGHCYVEWQAGVYVWHEIQ